MVRHVNLQEVALSPLLSQLTDAALKLFQVLHLSEPASEEVLAHHPTIQVIGIQVLKVTIFFPRIQSIAHVLVVCLCVSMNCLSDAA